MEDLTFTTQASFLHHGIEGQKWGVRNGPPYPLDRITKRQMRKIIREAKKNQKRIDEETKLNIVLDAYNSNKNIGYNEIERRLPKKQKSEVRKKVEDASIGLAAFAVTYAGQKIVKNAINKGYSSVGKGFKEASKKRSFSAGIPHR